MIIIILGHGHKMLAMLYLFSVAPKTILTAQCRCKETLEGAYTVEERKSQKESVPCVGT